MVLSDKQWKLPEDLVGILSPAEAATRLLSAQQYVTCDVALPLVTSLINGLRKEEKAK